MTHVVASLFVLLALTGVPSPAAAQTHLPTCLTLPDNIEVSPGHRAWLLDLFARSPTMHRQCLAIAGAPHVWVRVESVIGRLRDYRARTFFTRGRTGALRAVVQIPVSFDLPELLAHEFEHIIEQIEGLDLGALALVRHSGVREVKRYVFETTRAIEAGRSAAGEVLACLEPLRSGCGHEIAQIARKD